MLISCSSFALKKARQSFILYLETPTLENVWSCADFSSQEKSGWKNSFSVKNLKPCVVTTAKWPVKKLDKKTEKLT